MASIALQPTTIPPGPGRPPRPTLRVLDGGRAPARLAQQAGTGVAVWWRPSSRSPC